MPEMSLAEAQNVFEKMETWLRAVQKVREAASVVLKYENHIAALEQKAKELEGVVADATTKAVAAEEAAVRVEATCAERKAAAQKAADEAVNESHSILDKIHIKLAETKKDTEAAAYSLVSQLEDAKLANTLELGNLQKLLESEKVRYTAEIAGYDKQLALAKAAYEEFLRRFKG